MKLELKQPIFVIENEENVTYPYAHLSLSMNTGFSDVETYTFALRLVPYRVTETGEIIKLESHQYSISSLNGLTDQVAGVLTNKIITAVQSFIKGGE
jgi:hypothetical protein